MVTKKNNCVAGGIFSSSVQMFHYAPRSFVDNLTELLAIFNVSQAVAGHHPLTQQPLLRTLECKSASLRWPWWSCGCYCGDTFEWEISARWICISDLGSFCQCREYKHTISKHCFTPSSWSINKGFSKYFFWFTERKPSPVAQTVKNLPAVWETGVWWLGQEDPLATGMATYSRIFAWEIPWTEKSCGLQSTGSQRIGQDWATDTFSFKGHPRVLACLLSYFNRD